MWSNSSFLILCFLIYEVVCIFRLISTGICYYQLELVLSIGDIFFIIPARDDRFAVHSEKDKLPVNRTFIGI